MTPICFARSLSLTLHSLLIYLLRQQLLLMLFVVVLEEMLQLCLKRCCQLRSNDNELSVTYNSSVTDVLLESLDICINPSSVSLRYGISQLLNEACDAAYNALHRCSPMLSALASAKVNFKLLRCLVPQE